MLVKVNEASGPVLDWMTTVADGHKPHHYSYAKNVVEVEGGEFPFNYSTDWAQGGPIIDNHIFRLEDGDSVEDWPERWLAEGGGALQYGPTPLVAAMRCFVCSKLGDEVEVPEELTCAY